MAEQVRKDRGSVPHHFPKKTAEKFSIHLIKNGPQFLRAPPEEVQYELIQKSCYEVSGIYGSSVVKSEWGHRNS